LTWSATDGLRRDGEQKGEMLSPRAVLDFIAAHDGAMVIMLKDFHEPLRDSSEIRRRVRDLYDACLDRGKFVFISSPVKFIPEEIERNLVYLELTVPDLAEIVAFLEREAGSIAKAGGTVDTTPATLEQLARSLQGLTLDESRHAIRRALVARNALDQESVHI